MKTAQQYLKEMFNYYDFINCLTFKPRPRDHFQTEKCQHEFNERYTDITVGSQVNLPHGTYVNFTYMSEDYIAGIITGRHQDSQRDDLPWIKTYCVM